MSETEATSATTGGLRGRAIRGTLWTVGYTSSNMFLRLLSNMVLTRLLYPEAFGVMAIVQVFLNGLILFSDTGFRAAIIQHKRGDEKDFLDTAWTLQMIRCTALWLGTCILALPAAHIYKEPMLAQLLPVAGLSLLFAGFQPTAVHTADRHLNQGRVVIAQLISQIAMISSMIVLAYILRSVWALAIGIVVSDAVRTLAFWFILPNARNRFRLERSALHDIFHFGKFIFLSTLSGFVVQQGDRAVLGLHVPMAVLGVYNIAFFMATVPQIFLQTLQQKVVFPLQCKKPTTESAANRKAVFQARRLLTLGLLTMSTIMAFAGPWLVRLLYDPRFESAGPMITLYSLSLVPVIVLGMVLPTMLAAGNSLRLFLSQAATAVVQLALLIVGIQLFGVVGAIVAPGLAALLVWPLRMSFLRRYKAWDPVQDIALMGLGLLSCGAACVLHWSEIVALLP